ncbi:MAG: hypothetical protein KJ558_09735 [Gammaproteobacteria bacterium]|nr:hypothetical protein [Gammaproteobacteria bacterium]MBU1655085.1 hypothetical protein [Gammaproteobacteria bacterium]MBU1961557.1 hypothetical protein [Gammaproteobacteria bacterium]
MKAATHLAPTGGMGIAQFDLETEPGGQPVYLGLLVRGGGLGRSERSAI